MRLYSRYSPSLTAMTLTRCQCTGDRPAAAAAEIDREVDSALKKLYESLPSSKAARAKGILVFPDIGKDGLVLGGYTAKALSSKQGGTGGYYETVAASTLFRRACKSLAMPCFSWPTEAKIACRAATLFGPSRAGASSGGRKRFSSQVTQ
jgi:hypothetical protein